MERTTDSIERLALLMDRMDTKLDREKTNTCPEFIKAEVEDAVIGKTIMIPEIGHIVKIDIKITIEEGDTITIEALTEVIVPITEITVGPETRMATEMAIDIIIDQITEETMAIKDTVIEAKIMVDLGTETEEIEVVPEKVLNLGAAPKTGTMVEDRVEMIPGLGTDPNLDLDPLLM